MNSDTILSAVVAPKIKVGVFAQEHFVGSYDLLYLPRQGDYIEVGNHEKWIAWRIEAVVHLRERYYAREWEVLLVVGSNPLQKPSAVLFAETEEGIRKKRDNEIHQIWKERQIFIAPNEAWQRRRAFYERLNAGETAEQIAASEGMGVQRVKILIGQWRGVCRRVNFYRNREVYKRTLEGEIELLKRVKDA